jgi:hypothetical protein
MRTKRGAAHIVWIDFHDTAWFTPKICRVYNQKVCGAKISDFAAEIFRRGLSHTELHIRAFFLLIGG